MPEMLLLGRGAINSNRVIAVAAVKSDPIRRLIKSLPESQRLDLTFGYPRSAIIFMDNGLVILTMRSAEEVARALKLKEDADAPPWW